jgi:hypothetical protein
MIGGSHHPRNLSVKQNALTNKQTNKQKLSSKTHAKPTSMKSTQQKISTITNAGRRGEPHPENLRYGYLLPGQVRHSREAHYESVKSGDGMEYIKV